MTLTASSCLEFMLIAYYLRCFKPLLVALLKTLPRLGVFVQLMLIFDCLSPAMLSQPKLILDCVSPVMLSTAWKPSEINRLVLCGD